MGPFGAREISLGFILNKNHFGFLGFSLCLLWFLILNIVETWNQFELKTLLSSFSFKETFLFLLIFLMFFFKFLIFLEPFIWAGDLVGFSNKTYLCSSLVDLILVVCDSRLNLNNTQLVLTLHLGCCIWYRNNET